MASIEKAQEGKNIKKQEIDVTDDSIGQSSIQEIDRSYRAEHGVMGFKLRSSSVINSNVKELHQASLALKDPAPSKFA